MMYRGLYSAFANYWNSMPPAGQDGRLHQRPPAGHAPLHDRLYLEGVGAAPSLAAALGDGARREKYSGAAARGFRFLERLVIQQRDAPVLPNPSAVSGGLRQSTHRSEVRIDFVQHALFALLELRPDYTA
jgi:hypothetical protein